MLLYLKSPDWMHSDVAAGAAACHSYCLCVAPALWLIHAAVLYHVWRCIGHAAAFARCPCGHIQLHACCQLQPADRLPAVSDISPSPAPCSDLHLRAVAHGRLHQHHEVRLVSTLIDSWPVRFVATSASQTWWPPVLSRALLCCGHTPAALCPCHLHLHLPAAQQHAGATPGARTPEEQRRRHDGTCVPGGPQAGLAGACGAYRSVARLATSVSATAAMPAA